MTLSLYSVLLLAVGLALLLERIDNTVKTTHEVETRVSAPILGVVLNQLDVIRANHYYGEYSSYGRRYYNKRYSYGDTPKEGVVNARNGLSVRGMHVPPP